jgi:hypothetical protein
MFSCGGAESTQERYSQAGSRGYRRSRRETNDAQLFAQSARAPDQTDERSQHLYCQHNLTSSRLCQDATLRVFHAVSRAEGPSQQTTKSDRLPYSDNI